MPGRSWKRRLLKEKGQRSTLPIFNFPTTLKNNH
jgi:hypothetical protein